MGALDETGLRDRVARLAAIDRPSASPGEAQAARLIADELRELGARVALEEEPAHGGYWWPIGLANAAAALAARPANSAGTAWSAAFAATPGRK